MTLVNERTIASLTHLSTLTQYFIPLGNFIFPIIIWSAKKNESEFVDSNGKQTLNFQLSIFLYSIILCAIAIPIIIYQVMKNVEFKHSFNDHDFIIDNLNRSDFTGILILAIVAAILFGLLKVIEFVLVVYAAVKASNGENYKYPLTIPFFK